MSFDIVIEGRGLGKSYLIYSKPQDRLKQMIFRNRKYYQEYWAVQNANFEIKRGETVAIIGRNGSGKSTLLQMIAGTLTPNTGELSIKGRIAPLLELGAGFNPEFTGRENVRLSASILGLTDTEIADREADILAFAGIDDFIDQPVKTYSSGMFARLAFAVAAHVDADILIVDEILAVGDAAFVQKCMRFIRKFKETGTILFVSHDSTSVNALCDRAIWMDKGQIRAVGPAKDMSLAYQAALHGEADGQSFSISGRRRKVVMQQEDPRHAIIANSKKRNDIAVFEFDKDSPSFGAGGGRISGARFVDANGQATHVVVGGEETTLEIHCDADAALTQPIVGFNVRDRLGQNLFGDNTYLTYANESVVTPAGGRIVASFSFRMPYLPEGDYSVAVALATGTQDDHTHQHWVDDALLFHAQGGHYRMGLVGIPMHDIDMKIYSS